MASGQEHPATTAKTLPRPPTRLSKPRNQTTWTVDTCPTKKGQKPPPGAGRPRGSKDKAPRQTADNPRPPVPRGSVVAIFKHLAEHEPEIYVDAIKRGLKAPGAKSYPYAALAASYLDGKPIERIQVEHQHRLFVPAAPGQVIDATAEPVAMLPDVGQDEPDPSGSE